jgi:Ala-tRNA(Pro) deacylase
VAASDKNLFDQFAALGIQTTTVRHSPMFTVGDGEELLTKVPGGHCKTLFLKNKNENLWLIVMLGNIRLDMKMLQKNEVLHHYHSQNQI